MSVAEMYVFWDLAVRLGTDSFVVRRTVERLQNSEITTHEATDILKSFEHSAARMTPCCGLSGSKKNSNDIRNLHRAHARIPPRIRNWTGHLRRYLRCLERRSASMQGVQLLERTSRRDFARARVDTRYLPSQQSNGRLWLATPFTSGVCM